MKNAMHEAKKIHCVGVGGIAISGIAKLLHAQGVEVTGSDSQQSEITEGVAALGITVAIGHAAENVPADVEAIIFSEAVPEDNPERVEARRRGILEFAGADALAALADDKRLIAVTGTNGKSTTTAMIGLILERAGWDPTVVVGSIVPGWPLGSVRVGSTPSPQLEGEVPSPSPSPMGRGDGGEGQSWMVIEADEYARKLLKYHPDVAVITNIEEDHMDVYRDIDDIVQTFQQFVNQVKPGGFVAVNRTDPQSNRLTLPSPRGRGPGVRGVRVVEFGVDDLQRPSLCDDRDSVSIHSITLQIPGAFNRANAAAAARCASELGIPFETIKSALEDFRGIWRRFEVLGTWRGATVVSDYAHHPTALKATLKAAREWVGGSSSLSLEGEGWGEGSPDGNIFTSPLPLPTGQAGSPSQERGKLSPRIIAIFQPHHHHRTRALFDDFVRSFNDADAVVLTEVYDVAGREAGERVEIQELVNAVQKQYPGKTVINGGSIHFPSPPLEGEGKPARRDAGATEPERSGGMFGVGRGGGEGEKHSELSHLLSSIVRPGDLVLFLGAGDIDAFARTL